MLKSVPAQGKPGLRKLAAAIESCLASVEVSDPAYLPGVVACLKQASASKFHSNVKVSPR